MHISGHDNGKTVSGWNACKPCLVGAQCSASKRARRRRVSTPQTARYRRRHGEAADGDGRAQGVRTIRADPLSTKD